MSYSGLDRPCSVSRQGPQACSFPLACAESWGWWMGGHQWGPSLSKCPKPWMTWGEMGVDSAEARVLRLCAAGKALLPSSGH